jgi:hypothetical protein
MYSPISPLRGGPKPGPLDPDLYSFDGLADRSGKPVFYTAHTFSQGIMETVNDARHLYYYSLRDIPAGL